MKSAYFYTEGDGMYTMGCKTIDDAIEAMKKAFEEFGKPGEAEEYYGFSMDRVKAENIKKDRIYYHRACHFYTVGENWCIECGEQTKGNGREAFVLNI